MIPLDPMTYIARITERGEDGRPRTLELFYEGDEISVTDGDSFVTFTTTHLLEDNK
jgi:hypothetical protein